MKSKKNKIGLRGRLWSFFDRRPKILIALDAIESFGNRFMIIYFLFMGILFIGIPVVVMYFALPSEFKEGLTAVFGSILSVVVMPLILSYYNRKKDNVQKRYEVNYNMYLELSNIIISILTASDFSQETIKRFQDYIKFNYPKMCLSFSNSLITNIYCTYRYCEMQKIENVRYFGQKCLSIIRREGNVGNDFQISTNIIESITSNEK